MLIIDRESKPNKDYYFQLYICQNANHIKEKKLGINEARTRHLVLPSDYLLMMSLVSYLPRKMKNALDCSISIHDFNFAHIANKFQNLSILHTDFTKFEISIKKIHEEWPQVFTDFQGSRSNLQNKSNSFVRFVCKVF